MTTSLPYLASNKNVGALFEKIASAKVPSKFTQEFLQNTIGLKGTNDRQLIPLLRNMGFLDASGTPTESYSLLKNQEEQKYAIANGVRLAYRPLFDANENANDLVAERLKGLVSQVAGTDADMASRISSTFGAVVKLGDFKRPEGGRGAREPADEELDAGERGEERENGGQKARGLRTEFHYNIQIHLPSNGNEETYLNIFNAIRKTFQ